MVGDQGAYGNELISRLCEIGFSREYTARIRIALREGSTVVELFAVSAVSAEVRKLPLHLFKIKGCVGRAQVICDSSVTGEPTSATTRHPARRMSPVSVSPVTATAEAGGGSSRRRHKDDLPPPAPDHKERKTRHRARMRSVEQRERSDGARDASVSARASPDGGGRPIAAPAPSESPSDLEGEPRGTQGRGGDTVITSYWF